MDGRYIIPELNCYLIRSVGTIRMLSLVNDRVKLSPPLTPNRPEVLNERSSVSIVTVSV